MTPEDRIQNIMDKTGHYGRMRPDKKGNFRTPQESTNFNNKAPDKYYRMKNSAKSL